ncbi:hypothetical protein NP511_00430 [Natrinema thermotolerans]|uniref:Uncharacterized protein n=1 Tax=Natrinema thermotolerans TaxID=121872 RepID=A0AAF0T0W6_9EURY|nr:hypothetical protein [Natrinema thermotolerans]WMT07485.1 hypothetical protein NP511_19145 [Natrinema thermotolerans]WMT08117.1 hypothetical protein NP511_00430 [Natrinema thermotolerans]
MYWIFFWLAWFGETIIFINSFSLLIILLGITRTKEWNPLIALLGLGVFWPSITSFGHLYGRDSHPAAIIADTIAQTQTEIPVDTGFEAGFSKTPGLHSLAIVTSEVTSLPIVPAVRWKPLITGILPFIIFIVSLLIVLLTIRRFYPHRPIGLSVTILLFWTPMLAFRSAFRRPTIGLFAFSMIVCLYYWYDQTGQRRYLVPLFLIIPIAITGHHLATVMMILYSGIYLLTRTKNRQLMLALIIGSCVVLYYVFFNLGGSNIIMWIAGAGYLLLEGGSLDPVLPTYRIQGNSVSFFQGTVAPWIYQLILAIGVACYAFLSRTRRSYHFLLWGILTGILSVIAFATNVVDYTRMMTYFVIGAGWVAPWGYQDAINIVSSERARHVTTAIIVCLFLLGASMVPLHTVSQSNPEYLTGETSQNYPKQQYAVANWIDNHKTTPPRTIVGDTDTIETTAPLTGSFATPAIRVILSSDVPSGHLVVLSKYRNSVIFHGTYQNEVVVIKYNSIQQFDSSSNTIYSNNGFNVYGNSSI